MNSFQGCVRNGTNPSSRQVTMDTLDHPLVHHSATCKDMTIHAIECFWTVGGNSVPVWP